MLLEIAAIYSFSIGYGSQGKGFGAFSDASWRMWLRGICNYSGLKQGTVVFKNKFLSALVLLGLSLLAILPLWTVARLPLLDYPNHLARAFVLAHLHDPQYQFAHFFRA